MAIDPLKGINSKNINEYKTPALDPLNPNAKSIKIQSTQPTVGMGDVQRVDSTLSPFTPVKKTSLGDSIKSGFLLGLNQANKAVLEIPKAMLDLNNVIAKKTGLYHGDPIGTALQKQISNYDIQSQPYQNKLSNSSKTGQILGQGAAMIPEGIEMATELAIPVGKFGKAGEILSKGAEPLVNATTKLLGNNLVGKIASNAVKSGTEMALYNAGKTSLKGGNFQDVGNSALEGLEMGAVFGAGNTAVGELLGKGLPAAFKTVKEHINSVGEAQKQGLINAYAEKFSVTPETMTEALLKDQPLLLTAGRPKEAPLNILEPNKETMLAGGYVDKPLVRIKKDRTENYQRIETPTGYDVQQNLDIKNTPVFSGYVPQKVELPNIKNEAIKPPEISTTPPKVEDKFIKEDVRQKNDSLKSPTFNETTLGNSLGTPTNSSGLKPSIGATDRTKLDVDVVTSKEIDSRPIFEKGKSKTEDIYTHMIDINHPIRKLGDSVYKLATNAKKIGGTFNTIVNESLVDMKGDKMGESLSSIAKDVPIGKEVDFFNYILQRHNIDRAREGKPVDPSFTSEQSKKAVQLIEQRHPELKGVSDRLTKFLNNFEQEWGVNSGLIKDDIWQQLQNWYKNYVPTHRKFDPLETSIHKTNGKGMVDQSVPLDKATGSDRNIVNPFENIMHVINRTVRTAKYNEVGQEMLGALRGKPELSKYAEIVSGNPDVDLTKDNIVSVLEKGEPVYVQIKDNGLLEALQGLNKTQDLKGFAKGAKIFNGIFRALITDNPIFALKNMARDLPTGYINGSENNPAKYAIDLIKAYKDIFTNSKSFQRYKAVGGEMSNFQGANRSYKSVDEVMGRKLQFDEDGVITGAKQLNSFVETMKKGLKGIQKFDNAIESAPRLAEFKRTLQKTGNVEDALYKSGEITTNFARNGDWAKQVDLFVPYFNAGLQGLDKLARQVATKPIPTTLKGITGVTALTIALEELHKNNENYKALDNRTKDNYFLFPYGDKFIKIPKSREYGVMFGSLFERIARQVHGEKDSFKDFGTTVKTNFSPADPIENNILAPIYGLAINKDFANRTIVPGNMADRSPELQYDEKTSEIAKAIGKAANLSPKQVDYILKSYTGVIAQYGLPATTKSTYQNGNVLQKATKPLTTQFTSDPLYSNSAVQDFYENFDKINRKAADKNFTQNIPSKVTTKEERLKGVLAKTQTEISSLSKMITKSDQQGDYERVKELRQKIIEAAKRANKMVE